MKCNTRIGRRLAILALVPLAAGCAPKGNGSLQGYLEADFVYVAAQFGGRLLELKVAKGDTVQPGAALFLVDQTPDRANLAATEARQQQAESQATDLAKGARPTELDSYQATREQVEAQSEMSKLDLERQAQMFKNKYISQNDYDRVRLAHAADQDRVTGAAANLATAKLGGREDAVAAAQANARAAAQQTALATWQLAQTGPLAPKAALVYDTLYREGEYVSPGQAVVVLLPPDNIKVRFFVPEPVTQQLKIGQAVQFYPDDAAAQALPATINYVSPQAEYTPPVIFSEENTHKLVFMVEAAVAPEHARNLHPGLPVRVRLAAK